MACSVTVRVMNRWLSRYIDVLSCSTMSDLVCSLFIWMDTKNKAFIGFLRG